MGTRSGTAARPWAPLRRHIRRSSNHSSAAAVPAIHAYTVQRAYGTPVDRIAAPFERTGRPARNAIHPDPIGSPRHHTQHTDQAMAGRSCHNIATIDREFTEGAPRSMHSIL